MKKRQLLYMLIGIIVASLLLAACNSGKDEADKPQEQKQEESAKEKTKEPNLAGTGAVQQAAAFAEMKAELEKMKENKEVNWETVLDVYEKELKNGINEINPDFDQTISTAMEAGKSGELDPNLARQLIDKTTQSYFYQKQKALQKEAAAFLQDGKKDEAAQSFEQVKHLANEIFIPTAQKRDEYYELSAESSIVENIQSGLTAQEEALAAENAEDFSLYIQVTDKSIYRSYYLAANSYAEKIEAATKEGKDEMELKNMQAEGWGFLQAIKESLGGGDEAAAAKLNELFTLNTTDPASIKAEEVDQLFTKAISGKIKGYYEKAPQALEENEPAEAKIEAMEGNMFIKALQVSLNKKIGEESTKSTLIHAEEWFQAIEANNKEDIEIHGDAVLKIVNQL